MGTIADTANANYYLSFADQGNKFSFPFAEKRKLAVSVCRKQAEVAVFCSVFCIHINIFKQQHICISICIYAVILNGKWKPR
jgi:hypothetical protein